MSNDTRDKIRALNDQMRTNPSGGRGRIMGTASITNLGSAFFLQAIAAIAKFDAFDEDNDPHGEHDFAVVDVAGTKVYFKIDYFDLDLRYGSEDPSDAAKTVRVMTIMLPSEY